MKFIYEACDGYSIVKNWTTEEADEELSGYTITPSYAVSDDGVSTLAPLDREAEIYWKLRIMEAFFL